MDAKAWIALVMAAVTFGGIAVAANEKFITRAMAEELFSQQAVQEERARLELQLDLKKHEIEFLLSLDERDERDEKKLLYLEKDVDRIETRLLEID